jgi:hypothetical protein
LSTDTTDTEREETAAILTPQVAAWVENEPSAALSKAMLEIAVDKPASAAVQIWNAAMITLRKRREFPTDCTDQKLLKLCEQGGVIDTDECSLLNYNRQLRNDFAESGDDAPSSEDFIAYFEEVGRTIWMPRDEAFTQERLALHR